MQTKTHNSLNKRELIERFDSAISTLNAVGGKQSKKLDTSPYYAHKLWGLASLVIGIGLFTARNPYAIATIIPALNMFGMDLKRINVDKHIEDLKELKENISELDSQEDVETALKEFSDNSDLIFECPEALKKDHMYENMIWSFAPAFYVGGSDGIFSGEMDSALHLPFNIMIGLWMTYRGRHYRKTRSDAFAGEVFRENFSDVIDIIEPHMLQPRVYPPDFSRP